MLRYNIPDATSPEVVADWVELFITFGKGDISKTQLSSYVQASRGSDPDDDFVDNVWDILRSRILLYGNPAPFAVHPLLVDSLIDWEEYPEYLACLIYSLEGNPNTPHASAAEAGKYFERISNEAIKNYIRGESIIYGFPADQDLTTIANSILKEHFNYSPPHYRKDRNLDIIAWRSFEDNRASQIILFVQCASGNNWKTKIKELNLRAWEQYIHFAAPLLKGFSVPVIIADKELLKEISTDAGVVIDRPRLFRGTFGKTFSDASLSVINTTEVV
jgi:hypothetical protein